jgi:hypothetical protein
MNVGKVIKTIGWIFLSGVTAFFFFSISSCGKGDNASPEGLNIEYQVVNLSPDLYPIDLFINYTAVNASPFVFAEPQGYFYVPSTNLPYQVRSAIATGTTYFNLNDALTSGAKYTLYVTGNVANNSLDTLLTVDTALAPPIGHGKLRFVNVSPTATGGLDVYANSTKAFGAIGYLKSTNFISLPVGNYDIQIDATGTTSILNETSSLTIQDGRLYTIYAYGYNNRTDTAAFASAVTTNQ